MKVEHLSALSNDSTMRDTNGILPVTQAHFKKFGVANTKFVSKIEGTTLTCRVTSADGIAIFDLMEGETLLFVNVCCFSEEKMPMALEFVQSLASTNPILPKTGEMREPKIGTFIYTIPIMPFSSPNTLQLCGEIELYIYYELYKKHKEV